MKKVKVLVQMIIDNSAVWQTVQAVDSKYARRMSSEELTAIGEQAAEVVMRVVSETRIAVPAKKSGGLKIRKS